MALRSGLVWPGLKGGEWLLLSGMSPVRAGTLSMQHLVLQQASLGSATAWWQVAQEQAGRSRCTYAAKVSACIAFADVS